MIVNGFLLFTQRTEIYLQRGKNKNEDNKELHSTRTHITLKTYQCVKIRTSKKYTHSRAGFTDENPRTTYFCTKIFFSLVFIVFQPPSAGKGRGNDTTTRRNALGPSVRRTFFLANSGYETAPHVLLRVCIYGRVRTYIHIFIVTSTTATAAVVPGYKYITHAVLVIPRTRAAPSLYYYNDDKSPYIWLSNGLTGKLCIVVFTVHYTLRRYPERLQCVIQGCIHVALPPKQSRSKKKGHEKSVLIALKNCNMSIMDSKMHLLLPTSSFSFLGNCWYPSNIFKKSSLAIHHLSWYCTDVPRAVDRGSL